MLGNYENSFTLLFIHLSNAENISELPTLIPGKVLSFFINVPPNETWKDKHV